MRGTYTPLVGRDTITQFILLPGKIFDNITYIVNIIKTPLKIFMNNQSNEWNKQELLDNFKKLYEEDEIYNVDGIMSLLLWLYRDKVNIANNIFVLINELIKYKKHYNFNIIKSNSDDNISINYTQQIIELLIRIFDRDDDIDNEINDNIVVCSNDNDFVNLINSNIFPIPINRSNSELIKNIIQNNNTIDELGHLAIIVTKIHTIIIDILKMYNLFVEIGNKLIVNILDQPLTYLINYSNKLKSLN
jgi:hypothetical protein